MSNNFFISGLPKAGKTTTLEKLIKDLRKKRLKVCGFISPEVKEHGKTIGFDVIDIATQKREVLARKGRGSPHLGEYKIEIKSFEKIMGSALEKREKYDVVVIDEIGKMEMESPKFNDLLESVLNEEIPVIASLNKNFTQEYGNFGEIYNLTEENRGSIEMGMLEKIVNLRKAKKSSKKTKKTNAKRSTVKKSTPKTETKKHGVVHKVRNFFGF